MSIARGRDWGEIGPIPDEAVAAATDADAAAVVAAARRAGHPAPPVMLTGGDLARTLGAAGGRPATGATPAKEARGSTAARSGPVDVGGADRHLVKEARGSTAAGSAGGDLTGGGQPRQGARVFVDAGAALVDGRLVWFAAHLVARRWWWRGRVLVVANAAFMGRGNVAPRAHPGDGRLDVLDCKLGLGARIRARSRLAAGTHVPHPAIEQRRVAAAQFDLDPASDVYADGRRLARAGTVSVRVEPAALEIWIPLPAAERAPQAPGVAPAPGPGLQ